jgi:MFS family permease
MIVKRLYDEEKRLHDGTRYMKQKQTGVRLHYGSVVLALIVLAVFCALGLARFGYTSILPAMQQGLGLSDTQTGQLQSLNLFGYLLAVVPAGLLAARFGPRRVIAVSLGLVSAAMLLTGLAPSFTAACAGRFLAGIGGAGGNIPAMGLVSAWFGARRRGLASGIGVTGSSLALIVTGPLVPAIIAAGGPAGWRLSWYALGALGFAACGLCAIFLRNRPEEKGLLPFGESAQEKMSRGNEPATTRLSWGRVYRSGLLWQLALIYCAFGFSYIIYSTFFIAHLVRDAGFTAAGAGMLWMQVGIISLPSGLIWGSISDCFGRKIVLICVFALQALSFCLFGFSCAPWAIAVSALLFALTAWSIPALMAALAGDTFGPRLAPAALGLMTIIFGIGQVLGPYCAGELAHATGSFSGAFVIAGAAALLIGSGGSFFIRTSQ